MWNPDAYLAFADHRGRAFFDLTSRIGATAPRRVADLGCGPGNLTVTLGQRWPNAVLEAVDSAPEMVAAARERGLDAVVGDITDWAPAPDTDVVVSNAALQWVPSHRDVLVRWVSLLAPGAWIAMQVPGNFDNPSHRAVRAVARSPEFADDLADITFRDGDVVDTPLRYAELLTDAGCAVDAWESTYIHELAGETPVLDWITGTALTEVKARLSEQRWQDYRRAITPLLAQAYPVRPDGRTFFPFRRVFVVARVL
ncbi:trans-aconitate 2-methyltransferase [Mycobacterium sp. ACS4331]|uniref:trans-aconitate 2-methyltransferase n=1 Tax=Mycobacterium sp. ACS4331 TaxID=1834121 RepID=UPI0007FDC941|nr:trans-aconitate 2-methyltransferase [Mycobacterium sp. ACS4331]OBF16346.1 trans-aconitate methyltransferase [Mycobacterium sp. ACS4331]